MKMLVCLHSTTIMHRNAVSRSREEWGKQVLDGDESLYDFASYVPVDNAVAKLRAWKQQGAEILYLSPHMKLDDLLSLLATLGRGCGFVSN